MPLVRTRRRLGSITPKIMTDVQQITYTPAKISKVIGYSDIPLNTKAGAKTGIVWSQRHIARREYQAIFDDAIKTMVGADGMVEDEKQKEWQVRAVAKLEKLMITWVSPETGGE